MFYSYRKSHFCSHSPSFTAIRSRAYTRGHIYHGNAENMQLLSWFSRNRPGRTNYSATGISLGEMLTFRSWLRWKKVVAPPAAAGLLVQMDLGWLECMPPCARGSSGRQTQANYVYDERMSDGYI